MESYTDIGVANWLSASATQAWNTQGGDFLSSNLFQQTFDTGLEDLQVDITGLVESWISGTTSNFGVGIRLTGSQENSTDSYYTKKFFARGSEFFYKRPWIESRTDDSFFDGRDNFIISSSLLEAADNLNKLVLYNRVRGQLKNIPVVGTGSNLFVSLYAGLTGPTAFPLLLHNGQTKVQAGFYKTGIYTASVAINTTASYLYDVWFSGSSVESSSSVVFATGSVIYTQNYNASFENQPVDYVVTISNLKNSYATNEQPRFKIFARDRDWSPNLYTVASNDLENITIDNLFYKVIRIQDGLEVVPYGTGSIQYTKTSYDKDGNYFDLNMDIFEKDYAYGIKLGYKFGDDFNELKEVFKFRVER
jgi:hypothetical protein